MARLAGPPPDPTTIRSGIPSDLVAIDRKALAVEPADRWSSAASMAAALEAFLAGTALPGAVAGADGSATIAAAAGVAVAAGAAAGASSATARPNPNAIPYDTDAYATSAAGAAGADAAVADDGSSRNTWIAGIVALLILAAVAFLVFRLLSGPSEAPATQITVPNFVGQTLTQAKALATQTGVTITVAGSAQASGQDPNTVLSQAPGAGALMDKGGNVDVTLVSGPVTVAVPDVRGQTEQAALNALAAANLGIGVRTEAFDLTVPAGSVISQNPGGGVVVNEKTPIDYVVSKGPEPSASPSPSPSPTPSPTPPPTAPPTPPPTPTPTLPPTPPPTPPPSPSLEPSASA
jgi:serine/threonine-protein kinase